MKKHNHILLLLRHSLLPQALKASASTNLLHLHDQIYSSFLKCGSSSLNLPLATSLIHHFSRSDHLHRAHSILLDIPQPDTIAYNALLSGYAASGATEPAFRLFDRLRRLEHGPPDAFTFTSLLKSCSGVPRLTPIVHALVLKTGFLADAFVVNCVLDNYSKCYDLLAAELCFDELTVLDSVVWMTMVSGYVRNGELDNAWELFVKMRRLGLGLNEFSLASILGAFDWWGDLKQGREIHGLGIKIGFCSGAFTVVGNAVISMYCRCGCELDGITAFEEILEPDIISWTAYIGACKGEEALKVFGFLNSRAVEMNEYTVINVLSAVDGPRLLNSGIQIHARCFRSGLLLALSVSNVLISMYGKCGVIDDARKVFDDMISRDCVSWNSMIGAYAENGVLDVAIEMFCSMRKFSVEPTKFALANILEVISYSVALELAMQIHPLVVKLGFASDNSMIIGLITLYGRCDEVEMSKRVFHEISKQDVSHINAMASVLVQVGYLSDVLELFRDVRSLSQEVDGITFSIVFKVFSALTALEQGRNLHSLVLKCGTYHDSFVGSAIVDIYCKCGVIDEAVNAFEELPKDNVAAWNALITGYAQHGCVNQVFNLFKKMVEEGIHPDEITFLGILISCCHGGQLKEANDLLSSMVIGYGVIPCLEHYACLIDLLGRAGQLEEAKQKIDQMPIRPDARIWQIFLASCFLHGNIEMGNIAAIELLDLQPENESAYVLLSNLYASAGMWEEVGRTRRVMNEKTVSKEPGSSWIQLRGRTHFFFAGDTSHPQIEEIYLILNELNKQMAKVITSLIVE